MLQTDLHLAHADALRRTGCHEYRLGRNLRGQLEWTRRFGTVNLNDGTSVLGDRLGHLQLRGLTLPTKRLTSVRTKTPRVTRSDSQYRNTTA
jgi:hypothetical protein